jgi:hypothetical protein
VNSTYLASVAIILLIAQFALPWRYAFVPLLIATCHVGSTQIAPGLTVVRLLIIAGLFRACMSRNCAWFPIQPLDRLIIVWAGWAVLSSFWHEAKENYTPLTVHGSFAVDYAGTYFFARSYLQSRDDLIRFSKCLMIVLIPLALCLLVEKLTARNIYSALAAPHENAWIREGRVRAAGPFGNAILAGTVGGVCLPFAILLRRFSPRHAIAGVVACVVIVLCSASSGPLMTFLAASAGLMLWRWRHHLGRIRLVVVLGILGLALVMNAPVWYIVARIDLAGGSTSWHRAEVIHQAVQHFGEWWLVGTDYTRHWMAYGIQWSKDHIDITNHYIFMGVRGGLLLMALFIAILVKSFQLLGRKMKAMRAQGDRDEFFLWCCGASLFSHAITFLGVSYFDQSFVLLCLIIGAVPALSAAGLRVHRSGLKPEVSVAAGVVKPTIS